MTDHRNFSDAENRDGSAPAAFAGRSARGYAAGSTTVFTNNAPTQHVASSPRRSTEAPSAAAAPTGTSSAVYGNGSTSPGFSPQHTQTRAPSAAHRTANNVGAAPQSHPSQPTAARAVHPAERHTGSGTASDRASSPASTLRSAQRKTAEKTVPSTNRHAVEAAKNNRTSKKETETAAGFGNPPAKKKHSKGTVFLAALLAVIILAAGGGAGALAYVLGGYTPVDFSDNPYISEDKLKSSSKVTNILLMGIDTESTEASTRSDAMVLISVDSKNRKIKLTSFLRDMYITVPGHGETKLTHACSYSDGGPQLTCDSIELNFGIKIDGYAKIGYDIFREVVSAVDGITVAEIDETEAKALAEEGVYIEPGTNIHLDGTQALAYCRIRHGQSDFQRTERQRETIMLVLKKMAKMNPFKTAKLIRSVASEISCSVPKNKLAGLALKVLPCLLSETEQTQIPADGTWEYGTRDGMSVVLVNLEKNKNFLYEWIYGE